MMMVGCVVRLALLCASVQALARLGMRKRYFEDSATTRSSSQSLAAEKLVTQRLDHFNPHDNQTWQQRFWVRSDLYAEGGPVFLYISGEVAADASPMAFNMFWEVTAEKQRALMFQLEHRYYGSSRPTSDLSTENLKYLSSEQALADLASFIVAMNREHKLPEGSKWVAFGGSYAGSLAAWLRYKYPYLVFGAVSSSAPLLAKVDFPEFLDVVRESLRTYGDNCVKAIEGAVEELDHLLKSNKGREIIQKKYRLCKALNSKSTLYDVITLYDTLTYKLGNSVQNDFYNPSTRQRAINDLCDRLLNATSGSTLDNWAAIFNQKPCLSDDYDVVKKESRNITWDSEDRQWFYQTCSEFGYYQTSERKDSLMGDHIPLNYFTQLCADAFGPQFTKESIEKSVDRTNKIYGGLDLNATRVIFVHGSIDPWHTMGLRHTRIPESPVIFINGTSHCADMYEDEDFDPPALRAARRRISTIIGEWLKQPSTDVAIPP